jgi:hypothetical protein
MTLTSSAAAAAARANEEAAAAPAARGAHRAAEGTCRAETLDVAAGLRRLVGSTPARWEMKGEAGTSGVLGVTRNGKKLQNLYYLDFFPFCSYKAIFNTNEDLYLKWGGEKKCLQPRTKSPRRSSRATQK